MQTLSLRDVVLSRTDIPHSIRLVLLNAVGDTTPSEASELNRLVRARVSTGTFPVLPDIVDLGQDWQLRNSIVCAQTDYI